MEEHLLVIFDTEDSNLKKYDDVRCHIDNYIRKDGKMGRVSTIILPTDDVDMETSDTPLKDQFDQLARYQARSSQLDTVWVFADMPAELFAYIAEDINLHFMESRLRLISKARSGKSLYSVPLPRLTPFDLEFYGSAEKLFRRSDNSLFDATVRPCCIEHNCTGLQATVLSIDETTEPWYYRVSEGFCRGLAYDSDLRNKHDCVAATVTLNHQYQCFYDGPSTKCLAKFLNAAEELGAMIPEGITGPLLVDCTNMPQYMIYFLLHSLVEHPKPRWTEVCFMKRTLSDTYMPSHSLVLM